MKDLPLVSVLLPVYQVEEYIERCARSVFEQTYQNLEFVFVDDGSTDSSIDILQGVINDYDDLKDHIRIIRHPDWQLRGIQPSNPAMVIS